MNNNVSNIDNSKNVFVFDFAGHEVRALKSGVIGKQPWFLEKDISHALGFTNSRSVYKHDVNDEDEMELTYKQARKLCLQARRDSLLKTLWSRSDFMPKALITKQGVFDLILNSRIPQAKRFKHWLTHDVLPQIDKTGNYVGNSLKAKIDVIKRAGNLAVDSPQVAIMLSNVINGQAKQIITKNRELAKTKPKAQAYDEFDNNQGLISTTTIAKDYFGKSARWLNQKLHQLGVQYKQGRHWVLTARYSGYGFAHYHYCLSDIHHDWPNLKWTGRGKHFVLRLMTANGYHICGRRHFQQENLLTNAQGRISYLR